MFSFHFPTVEIANESKPIPDSKQQPPVNDTIDFIIECNQPEDDLYNSLDQEPTKEIWTPNKVILKLT